MLKLLDIDPWDLRRSCECCGTPTLGVPLGIEEQPDFYHGSTACLLCEWESAPLGSDGTVRATAESDGDRNDGLALAAARAAFARFASVYAPDAQPEWRVSAPDAVVVSLRGDLQQAFARLAEASPDDRYRAWGAVKEVEAQLSAALSAQQERDMDSVERAL